MNFRRNPEPGRQAVLWLATAFVVMLGAVACGFIIVVAVDRPSEHIWVWATLFGGLVIVLVSFAIPRDRHSAGQWLRFWLLTGKKRDPQFVLRLGRKQPTESSEIGTNSPPTLESVREAAEQNVVWVPHGRPPDRQRPRRS